jgi:hypothetical protein
MNVLKVLKKGADISILHKAYESNIPWIDIKQKEHFFQYNY